MAGVPGLLFFRRLRVVRGLLVCGCHGVDGHDVDEAVDGVRRLVGAAVTHFNAESELVPLVCDVVKDGGALFLAANGVVPFFDLACLGGCDLHGCPLSLACAVRVSRFVSCLFTLYHKLGWLACDVFGVVRRGAVCK